MPSIVNNIHLGIFLFVIAAKCAFVFPQMSEDDRLKHYYERQYSWPLPEVVPNTEGWRNIFDRRWNQVERIPDSNPRYNGWLQSMSAGLVQPNFTENGWGLTRAPEGLVKELRDALHRGLLNATLENNVDVIEGQDSARPLFIPNHNLNDKVLNELKPMHEQWSGVELEGEIAYGLRVYRNNSRLLMHVDKPRTHIISAILHIDHSEDSEHWPIFIEDFQGNTNEVILENGDMLFYESSKCFHGRPRYFKGSWYSSIFVHYYPKGWDHDGVMMESHYAVPKHWSHVTVPEDEDDLENLIMVGTSMKEPECEDVWCAAKNTVKLQGPAPGFGKVLSSGGVVTELNLENFYSDEL